MKPLRALIVGLDGAAPDLIGRWTGEGRLPNLSSLQAGGAHGRLRSTLPCGSPAAWSTFFTGVNPAKHGVYGFFRIHPGAGARVPCLPGDLSASPFWASFPRANLRIGVADLPFADPATVGIGNGFFFGVQLRGAHRVEARPPALSILLQREFPDLLPDVYWQGVAEGMASPDQFLADLERLTDERSRLLARVLEVEPCDVLTVVLGGIDRLQHAFWRWMAPGSYPASGREDGRFGNSIRNYYEQVDALLGGWISRWCDERTHVVILSDHGFGPLRGEAYLNNWLRARGDLRLSADAPAPPPPASIPLRRKIGSRFPEAVKALLRPIVPAGTAAPAPLPILDHPEWIDWTSTRAIAVGGGANGVYLNVPPLFPGGAFASDVEADEFRRTLREDFRTLSIPGSETTLFRRVVPAEDELVGPFLDQAPHLLLEGDGVEVVDSLTDGPWYDPAPAASGHHLRDGYICLRGPRIRPGPLAEPLRMADVAPALLTALDLPVPAPMDGAPPNALFRNGPGPRRGPADPLPIRPDGSPRTDEQLARIRTELQRLGYLRT